MAPRIKIDSKFSYFGVNFVKHVRRFYLLLQIEKSHMFHKIHSKVTKFTISFDDAWTCYLFWVDLFVYI